jgi:hypothetical protein
MNGKRAALAVAALLALLSSPPAGAHETQSGRATAGVALDWYDITSQTVAAAAYPEPITSSRAWAISWLAAARAVDHDADPRFETAAFASALHDTLAALVPAREQQLDDALALTLASIPDGSRKDHGITTGRDQAAAVLAERADDGLDTASIDTAWSPPPAAPGVWQPTPPTFGPAVRAGQRFARPFLLVSNVQFRPGPPPALDSSTYLNALAEVRDIGSATSSTRTATQTDVARFWAQNSIDAYTQVLRTVLARSDRPLSWGTRLVAAFHAITVDAQIAIYDAKYAYVFWRPVTAIRTGSVDPDPNWTPLINTPRHPEYPSGHTGYAGAAERILQMLVGPRPSRPITLTSPTDPGSTHSFSSWSAITDENIDGRVWEGIHFRFSDETGARLGRRVAEYDLGRLSQLGYGWGPA